MKPFVKVGRGSSFTLPANDATQEVLASACYVINHWLMYREMGGLTTGMCSQGLPTQSCLLFATIWGGQRSQYASEVDLNVSAPYITIRPLAVQSQLYDEAIPPPSLLPLLPLPLPSLSSPGPGWLCVHQPRPTDQEGYWRNVSESASTRITR